MPTDETRSGSARLEFHGGLAGALLPLALFALGIVFVTISGMITIRAYFGPLVLVIGMVILLAKDRTAACEAMLSGVADRTLALMIIAFLGAGVLGQILVELRTCAAALLAGERLIDLIGEQALASLPDALRVVLLECHYPVGVHARCGA